jgi:hypothetical protein
MGSRKGMPVDKEVDGKVEVKVLLAGEDPNALCSH